MVKLKSLIPVKTEDDEYCLSLLCSITVILPCTVTPGFWLLHLIASVTMRVSRQE